MVIHYVQSTATDSLVRGDIRHQFSQWMIDNNMPTDKFSKTDKISKHTVC